MELVAADLDRRPWTFKPLAWLKDWHVARPQWLHDKRLIFSAIDDQSGDWGGWRGLWAVDADGQEGRILIDGTYFGYRVVLPANRQMLSAEWALHSLAGDGSDDVFVVRRGWRGGDGYTESTLARIDTRAPAPRVLSRSAPDGVVHWILDDQGQPHTVQTLVDARREVWSRSGEQWKKLLSVDETGAPGWRPRFVLEGELFVADEVPGRPGSQLWLLDAATGAPGAAPILAGRGFDVGHGAWPLREQANRGPLVGWRYRLDGLYTLWGEPEMAQAQTAIDQALPGRVNLIDCVRCLQAPRWLVTSLSDREPPAWYVFERETGALVRVGSARPALEAAAGGTRSFHRIQARDGRDLPVYITRPPGMGQRAAARPTVLLIHGGPASRTRLEWSAVPQFLASRGYVVVEPDFRGSTGYGVAHERTGWRQWGAAMQDDMQDALRWAIQQGWADGERACIMGASFGGYSALMGPVRYAKAFRCAVAWVAPTDLPALVEGGLRDTPTALSARSFTAAIGTVESVAEASALRHVPKLDVPVLAGFGVQDARVPIVHGRRLRDAAREAKVELEYVEYADEGHNWLKADTRVDFFSRVEKQLARTIGR
jgi:dienelactone hydrolase